MIGRRLIALAIFCAFTVLAIEGRRVLLRPISAAEVRRILKRAGREDAIPEGRVISQGLAAVKGFALGITKGVIGLSIADGIAAMLPTNTSSSSSSSKPSVSYNGTTNELCFTSRSATSDIVESGDARLATTPTGSAPTGTAATTGTVTNTGVAETPTTSTMQTTAPTTSNTATNTNTGTNTGTNTQTATTTETEAPEPTVSCIVINKKQ